ncbi:MAG: hypothetical protein ABL866_09250 [Devosia sp.]
MAELQSAWDTALAKRLIGKTTLIGITTLDPRNNVVSRAQFFGKVDSADPKKGISITLGGSKTGQILRLPPDLSTFTPATPGTYNLRNSTDQVTNPDYTALWEVHQPEKK